MAIMKNTHKIIGLKEIEKIDLNAWERFSIKPFVIWQILSWNYNGGIKTVSIRSRQVLDCTRRWFEIGRSDPKTIWVLVSLKIIPNKM